ncbi:bL28 family ribosomal protein [Patescibacteria group bacterium]
MSRRCDICSKGYMKANLVPRGIGRRVTNRAIKRQQPNIRNKKMTIKGVTKTYGVCTSCLKRMKFEKKKKDDVHLARTQEVEVKIEEPKKVESKKEEKKTTKKVEKKEEKKEVVEKKEKKEEKKTTKKKETKTKKEAPKKRGRPKKEDKK